MSDKPPEYHEIKINVDDYIEYRRESMPIGMVIWLIITAALIVALGAIVYVKEFM
tara:strand:- start:321 stop:485 length:165 start_codon:yes stop_codon:yes gene_type:complete